MVFNERSECNSSLKVPPPDKSRSRSRSRSRNRSRSEVIKGVTRDRNQPERSVRSLQRSERQNQVRRWGYGRWR